MKTLLLGIMLIVSSASYAQGPQPDTAPGGPAAGSTGQLGAPNWQPGAGGTEGGSATGDLTNKAGTRLSADDHKALRAILAAQKIQSVTLSEVFSRGKVLPKDIPTHAIGDDPRYATLRFAHVNSQFLLIDDRDTIVDVLD